MAPPINTPAVHTACGTNIPVSLLRDGGWDFRLVKFGLH